MVYLLQTGNSLLRNTGYEGSRLIPQMPDPFAS